MPGHLFFICDMHRLQKYIDHIHEGKEHLFYISRLWRKVREDVLREHHYECQDCRKRGRYTRATTVHHEKELRDFPELAVSKTYVDERGEEKRQLTPLCDECHKKRHAKYINWKERAEPLTEERWD